METNANNTLTPKEQNLNDPTTDNQSPVAPPTEDASSNQPARIKDISEYLREAMSEYLAVQEAQDKAAAAKFVADLLPSFDEPMWLLAAKAVESNAECLWIRYQSNCKLSFYVGYNTNTSPDVATIPLQANGSRVFHDEVLRLIGEELKERGFTGTGRFAWYHNVDWSNYLPQPQA